MTEKDEATKENAVQKEGEKSDTSKDTQKSEELTLKGSEEKNTKDESAVSKKDEAMAKRNDKGTSPTTSSPASTIQVFHFFFISFVYNV